MAWVEVMKDISDEDIASCFVNTEQITLMDKEYKNWDDNSNGFTYWIYLNQSKMLSITEESYNKLMEVIKSEQSPKQKWHPHFNYEKREDDLR